MYKHSESLIQQEIEYNFLIGILCCFLASEHGVQQTMYGIMSDETYNLNGKTFARTFRVDRYLGFISIKTNGTLLIRTKPVNK